MQRKKLEKIFISSIKVLARPFVGRWLFYLVPEYPNVIKILAIMMNIIYRWSAVHFSYVCYVPTVVCVRHLWSRII